MGCAGSKNPARGASFRAAWYLITLRSANVCVDWLTGDVAPYSNRSQLCVINVRFAAGRRIVHRRIVHRGIDPRGGFSDGPVP